MVKSKQTRSFQTSLHTRADDGDGLTIEGYFAVFDKPTELWEGFHEVIERGAFTESLRDDDVVALYDHNTANVLGRVSAGTLELREDEKGLWGSIRVNEHDTDAMNLYQRVKRGDISECSFGFSPTSETWENRDDGSTLVRVEKVRLYEVSLVAIPAYDGTGVEARRKQAEENSKRVLDKRKKELKERFKK